MADLHIRITVENTDANRKLAETDRHVTAIDQSAARTTPSLNAMETSLGKVAAVSAGIAALKIGFDGLSRFVGASVTSFSQQENAVIRLTTALRAQGTATPAVIDQYVTLATTFQNTTVFADELITEMQALLVQVGNVMPQDMGRALTAATDLAAGLGIDLRTATLLMGKAFEGETGTLKRYGIVIDESKLKTEGATAVMEAINAKFGGQAQAQLETYTGKTALLGNRMDELREKVGELITRSIGPILDLFLRLPTPIQNILLGLGAVLVILTPIAIGFTAIATAVGPLIPLLSVGLATGLGIVTGAFTALSTFVTATIVPMLTTALPIALRGLALLLTPPAGLVIAGILAVVAIWRNWDTIGPIVMNVYTAVKTWLVDKFAAIVESIRAKVDAVTGFFKGMYDKVVGQSYVPDMMRGIEAEFTRLSSVMVSPAEAATRAVSRAFEQLVRDTGRHLTEMTARVIPGWGKALTGGFGVVAQSAVGVLSSVLTGGVGAALTAVAGLAMKGLAAIGRKIGGWVKGLFRGGEEGTVVNPARETWWTSMGGLEGVNEGLMRSGLSWDETERLSQAVFGAKTKSAFDTATSQVEQILGRSITEGINRDLFPSFTHGTGGRYLDFGPGTLALLHGREKITPATAAEPTMRPVHVHVNLDGREIAWALVPHLPDAQAGLA
ncbi:MAG: hypothetical protein EWM73_03411 [Nitrospira sp.]|nr:MAG: hypothetical protein EWM73_03411 [Nitrospira sp.]